MLSIITGNFSPKTMKYHKNNKQQYFVNKMKGPEKWNYTFEASRLLGFFRATLAKGYMIYINSSGLLKLWKFTHDLKGVLVV